MTTTGALARLRAGNAQAITVVLAREGALSRADLVRGTGLSRATVSSLVAELIEAGRVVETSERVRPHRGGSGRPPVLVRLSAPTGIVAGVDLGHRHVRVVVADRAGEVLAEERRVLDVDGLGVRALEEAATMVREAVDRAGEDLDRLRAVGACLPAPLARGTRELDVALMPAWSGVDPERVLARLIGVAVHVDNDANLGALAELGRGSARLVADVVYVKLASGVGAGLVLGGRLHRGAGGRAGELGHVTSVPDGLACRCGRSGCLETEVSTDHLQDLLRPVHGAAVEDLVGLAEQGHEDVRRVLQRAGQQVGRVLADLVTALDPSVVVVGGPLGRAAPVLDGVRAGLRDHTDPDVVAGLEVRAGALGERAEVLGAVSLALSRVAQA
ncbi:ROK family transcriptional regulator [Nocardioides sp. AX2bis]|uniref:ROK family transcriptional regulator n=1 Tax=Nocardioides sp. AX2bis TaxID=2653157 RepID=UPI0012F3615D|nr:ROK family protein [Nocardioides sp. AX2bis]VXB78565.1 ROK family transcriptional regulator [Nocardioides sp. AX2bis]